MSRAYLAGVMVMSLGVGAAQADVLDISMTAQGVNYNTMVRDAKLRGDGGLQDWNLGAGSGGSNRFYANYLLNGSPSGRLNTFLQWFDVSSIPAGSVINSATLTTYMANQSANTRTWVDVNLSRLQSGNNWVEFVLGGAGPHTDGSVTWNNRITHPTTPTPWATPGALGGADIDLGTTQTFDVVGIDGQATTVVRDISAWVQGWVTTPASNAGILWWGGKNDDSNAQNRYFHFGTKEDGGGPASDTVSQAPSLVINYTPGGSPVAPIIAEVTPDPDNNAFAGQPYSKQLTLTQGTNPITWSVLAGSPPGTVVSGSGLVSGWTPTVGDIGNTFTINIKAENAQGNDTESWQVTVHGVPPIIAEVTPDPDTASVGTGYTKQLTLTQGTLPVTWSVVQGPSGTTVNSSGFVSGWTPTQSDAGSTFTFEIQAQNAYNPPDTETWQVKVRRTNNGFSIDSVFVVRDPNNGGQVREFDKHTGAIITDEFLPDESDWQSITFSGKGIGNDARMFVARPNGAGTDIEIAEINYLAVQVNSANLSTIINATVGSAVAFGNIRYSTVTDTLFVALNPNENTTSTAVCYEFPLSLAANSRIHTYLGETLPAVANPPFSGETRVAVAINRRDGTLYMVGQHLGVVDTVLELGRGDVIAFSTTAGPFNGQGVNTTFAVLIDGQTENGTNGNYLEPSTPIYRKKSNGDDTLLIPTNTDTNTPVQEFYLDTTLHPVDGNGNLALLGSPLTIGRGWNGQQDIETGDIWLGAKHHQFHVIRANDATASYEAANRDWFDAAVPPFQACNEPFADVDGNNVVDLNDFAQFQLCYTGSDGGVLPGCGCFDRLGDGDVDVADFNEFADCKTEHEMPWSQLLTPNCNP